MSIILLFRSGITVLGFSTDGDVRPLNCMKCKTESITQTIADEKSLFLSTPEKKTCYAQDHIHNGTKARNRILKPGIVLPMGKKIVSVSHLRVLINRVPKEIHGLVLGDICPDDRQNFGSLEKIAQPRVLKALAESVIDSEATIMYLTICREIYSAFIDVKLEPLERVYNIFHATYFLRAWRTWIQRPGKHQSIYSLN